MSVYRTERRLRETKIAVDELTGWLRSRNNEIASAEEKLAIAKSAIAKRNDKDPTRLVKIDIEQNGKNIKAAMSSLNSLKKDNAYYVQKSTERERLKNLVKALEADLKTAPDRLNIINEEAARLDRDLSNLKNELANLKNDLAYAKISQRGKVQGDVTIPNEYGSLEW